jgi:hypothetical protein
MECKTFRIVLAASRLLEEGTFAVPNAFEERPSRASHRNCHLSRRNDDADGPIRF